jgi:hypothetical protein
VKDVVERGRIRGGTIMQIGNSVNFGFRFVKVEVIAASPGPQGVDEGGKPFNAA